MTNDNKQQAVASVGATDREARPRVPIATMTAHDYGTMSQSIPSSVENEISNRSTSQQKPLRGGGEPPKAAIRRKIPPAKQVPEQFTMVDEKPNASETDSNSTPAPDSRVPAPVMEQATTDKSRQEMKTSLRQQNVPDNDDGTYQTVKRRYVQELGQEALPPPPIIKSVDSNQLTLKAAQTFQQQQRPPADYENADPNPKRRYPKKVLFIVANEFCERFSYYGLRTVLVLYFRSVLGFTDSGSTVSFHLFTTLCYLTPILGAILGDSILGKYKTILYLSIVYFLGELLLVVSSVWWDFGLMSMLMTWAALVLIGVGTGGIKPCVSAFGGDQFHTDETKWRENFFSLFYGAINLGSLISMFLTPMLRAQYKCVGRSDCYPLAFLLPCLLMLAAIVVFLLAHHHYYVAPLPEKNLIFAFCQCACLALKRKLAGYKLPDTRNQLLGHASDDLNSSASTSSLSMASSGTGGTNSELKPVVAEATIKQQMALTMVDKDQLNKQVATTISTLGDSKPSSGSLRRRDHWLYLASDCYDANSIEEFRCVLAIFFLFLPTPMFWALFDQQGSLWTLQATRMDGRLWGTNYRLEPDQMMVANPVLLLASIPLFQLVIYPMFNKCNLLTTPIQKMTTGGFLAALTFVLSALIEFQIQASLPAEVVPYNQASILLVNGISDCALVEPTILTHLNEPALFGSVEPLGSQRLALITGQLNQSETKSSLSPPQSYKLTFKLGNSETAHQPANTASVSFKQKSSTSVSSTNVVGPADGGQVGGCPFDTKQNNELLIGPLSDQAVHLLYIEQGNGKLNHKLFNESLKLPEAGKARVRLLYESFGSYSQATKRQFYLAKDSDGHLENTKSHPGLGFKMSKQDGQVLLSDYIEVPLSTTGDTFTLVMDESGTGTNSSSQLEHGIKINLRPGTRNLIILHQKDARSFELRQQLLQDNDYRISIFYQLAPYMLISASEVLFSITGLEFSYSMAPPDLKSLILGAWCLTTAFGNLLTVAIESIHFFDNIGYDFLLYAALMFLDILLFAIIGYNFEPYEPVFKSAPNLPKRQPQQPMLQHSPQPESGVVER